VVVLVITLLGSILGASNVIAKDSKDSSSGSDKGSDKGSSSGSDNKINDNNKGNDQQPPEDQQPPPTGVGAPPPPPLTEPLLPVNPPEKIDCAKTPNDPSCSPSKPEVPPQVDCKTNPSDQACLSHCMALGCPGSPPALTPALKQGPDKDCAFNPDGLDKCKPDKNGNCPPGFGHNESGNCFPNGPCPKGYARHDEDESGRCFRNPPHPGPFPPFPPILNPHCHIFKGNIYCLFFKVIHHNSHSSSSSDASIKIPNLTPSILTELRSPLNNVKDQAVLLLYSNVEWSGSILDTRLHSATQDGKGDSKLQFVCNNNENNGMFSLSFQKLKTGGYLVPVVIKGGKVLANDQTTAAFGVVSMSGKCG